MGNLGWIDFPHSSSPDSSSLYEIPSKMVFLLMRDNNTVKWGPPMEQSCPVDSHCSMGTRDAMKAWGGLDFPIQMPLSKQASFTIAKPTAIDCRFPRIARKSCAATFATRRRFLHRTIVDGAMPFLSSFSKSLSPLNGYQPFLQMSRSTYSWS